MSAEDEERAQSEPELDEAEQDRLRQLVRGALKEDEPAPASVLSGVQRKLRERSRGKFYRDAWSTSEQPPVGTYLVTAALMLFVLFLIYIVLAPTAGEPVPVQNEPAPVQLIPPPKKR
jgi:hypothetical protein